MTPLAEISPIDPSTGNQFNPSDPAEPRNRLAISVEDVQEYRHFILDQFKIENEDETLTMREYLHPFLDRLTDRVHPLALGNVHRVHQQIKQLARNLLQLHAEQGSDLESIITALTTRFYSHLHMINRYEAREILGAKVIFASGRLSKILDDLLREYENDFDLRKAFFLNTHLGESRTEEARFIGGAIESKAWSYLFETNARLHQYSAVPPNIQIQLPPGQGMPLISGLPREHKVELLSQGWARNTTPRGVTR